MLEALDSGQFSGAAIDAYRQEPPGHHPLVRHENAIAVPHVGGFSTESIARAVEAAVENLLQVLEEGSKG